MLNLKKSILLIGARYFFVLLPFVISIFIANIGGEELLGKYYLYISVITCLAIFLKGGVDILSLREASRLLHQPIEYNRLCITSAYSLFIISIAIGILFFYAFNFLSQQFQLKEVTEWLFFFFGGIGIAIVSTISGFFKAKQQQFLAIIMEVVTIPILFLIVYSIYVYLEKPEIFAKIYGFCSILVASIAATIFIMKTKFYIPVAKNIVSFIKLAIPIFLVALITFLINNLSVFLIAKMSSLEDLGVFQFSFRLVVFITSLNIILSSIYSPKFSKLYSDGNIADLEQLSKEFAAIGFVLTSIMLIALNLFQEPFLDIFLDDFRNINNLILIFSFGYLLVSFIGPVGFMLTMTNHEVEHLGAKICSLILILCSMPYLINIFGIEGAAMSLTGSIIFLNLLNTVIVRYRLGFWIYPSFRSFL